MIPIEFFRLITSSISGKFNFSISFDIIELCGYFKSFNIIIESPDGIISIIF